MSLNLRKLISEELKNFPHRIVERLWMGVKTQSSRVVINEKVLDFTWTINGFYNLSNIVGRIGVDITIDECKIDGEDMTSSHKKKFTSDNPIGKLQKIIVDIVRTKLNRKLHSIDNSLNVDYIEFDFK